MAEVSKWGALGYQQVPGLANRIISRYLRTQRKTMLRFFTERGLIDLAERMRQIRRSRQGMMAKNRMFQAVLNEYSERVTPRALASASPEAENTQTARDESLAVRVPTTDAGDRTDTSRSVSAVANNDGAGVVIEE